MVFKTSNSIYQIDLLNKRIRKLESFLDPNNTTIDTDVWKHFCKITDPQIGQPTFIFWESKGFNKNILVTITSEVLEILMLNI